MISDLIVGIALLFTAGFSAAWLALPRLRERVERPKFEFMQRLRDAERRMPRGTP